MKKTTRLWKLADLIEFEVIADLDERVKAIEKDLYPKRFEKERGGKT